MSLSAQFDAVAAYYDTMVGLSPGYHGQLRASAREFVRSLPSDVAAEAGRVLRVVDLGCGSGASTVALAGELAAAGIACDIVGIDASAGMIRAARQKALPGVEFVHGTAQQLARGEIAGIDRGLDGVFAAYLLRNVPEYEREEFLAGLLERLRPGAPLLLHDYSVAGHLVATAAWTALCWGVVIPLSAVMTRRPGLFTYLWRSVLDFDSVDLVMERLQRARYTDVRAGGVPGWQGAMVHMIHGRRR